ncbi:hypothetical protein SmJEL517_g05210 [Synchytrium microbalum]|uniref:ABC transporter domain-containing protein n=1 Tax=Synchytrium microbalum TaxID=1806994 RepID=A0A507BMR8_9FUNG|nr:uncharacterized protein SmJEL517_g05210 [Synchytrium microbalum]TPX31490.1 hypothetical protein SmJEL517_g05210 [Synchytrium microbalum]
MEGDLVPESVKALGSSASPATAAASSPAAPHSPYVAIEVANASPPVDPQSINKRHSTAVHPESARPHDAVTKDDGGYTLSWHDLSYTVKIGKKPQVSRVLLNNLNGFAAPGELVAIMGGSGAGKSTLLNVLSGRVGAGELGGKVLINGHERSPKTWRRIAACNVQETLEFAAKLRLPKSLTHAQKMERVNDVIMELGLSHIRSTPIGDSELRGISGGERKRVAIGVELLTRPKILFLDEPTSGLDSFNANNLMTLVKGMAVSRHQTVVATIHQPRTDILEKFDKVILLANGKLVWFGTVSGALHHFASLGYPLPDQTNPSDHFLDIVTPDRRTKEREAASLDRIETFAKAFEAAPKAVMPDTRSADDELKDSIATWNSTWFYELTVLFARNIKEVFRDKATWFATIGQSIFLTILLGFIYFRVGLDSGGIQNRIGVLFFVCINQSFGVIMPQLPIFVLQRSIVKRERAAGSYRSSSAYIAKALSTIPITLLGALLLGIPLYWMIGLQATAAKFFTFLLILAVHAFTANSVGLFLGSIIPNLVVGQIVGPLLIVVMLLFAGPLANLDTVPAALRWIQWISFVTYSNKALDQNEFTGLVFPAGGLYSTGEAVISTYKVDNPAMWYCILINFCMALGWMFLGYLGFDRTSRPLLRLK